MYFVVSSAIKRLGTVYLETKLLPWVSLDLSFLFSTWELYDLVESA